MKTVTVASIAIIIVAVITAVALLAPSETETPGEDVAKLRAVKIGMLLPLTGDFSSYGQESKVAALYGIETFNKHLESIGEDWYLDPIVEDTATNPVQALEKIQNLRAKNVELVLGHTSTSLNAVKSYANSNGIMIFSCTSTAPSLAIPGDNIFRLIPDDRQQAKALAALLKDQGIKVAVTVWRSDTYGDGLSEHFKKEFDKDGGIADEGIRYNSESPEFSISVGILNKRVTSLTEEYGANNVGILMIGFAETVQFMQSASQHEALKNVRWFGSDSISQEYQLIEDPITKKFTEDVSLTTGIVGFASTPTSEKLRAHVFETLGREPTTFAKTAYDIMWLYGLSILETDSDRSADVLSVIYDVASEYSGAIGPTILNENGDLASSDYSIHQVSNGEWVYVGTYHKDGTIMLESEQTATKSGLSGPVKLGLLSPLTGSLSGYGEITLAGSLYGIETFNKHLKSSGEDWYLDAIVEDTATNPVHALEKIQNLKAKNIELVMGGITSASTSSIRQYANNNNMIVFACCSSAPSLAIGGDSVFRLAPDDRQQARALATVMKNEGIETYVPIWRGDPYGDGINEPLKEYFEQDGGQYHDGIRYNPESKEFSVEASILADTISDLTDEYGTDKTAIVLTAFDEATPLMQSANSYEVLREVRWFGTNSLTHSDILHRDPISAKFSSNVNFTALIVKPEETQLANNVREHIAGKIGRNANMFALTSYDISWIYGMSVLQAQSDRAEDILPILTDIASEYTGASGKIALNENGDVKSANYEISTITGSDWTNTGVYHSNGTVTMNRG